MSNLQNLDGLITNIKSNYTTLENDINSQLQTYEELNNEKKNLLQRIADISLNIETLKDRKVVLENTIRESEEAYKKIMMSTQLLVDTISSKIN